MKLAKMVLLSACFLTLSRSGSAGSILVGTNLANLEAGAGLCPSDSNCEDLQQQFTLTSPVVIDQIKVVMEPYGNFLDFYPGGDFTVALGGFTGSGELPPNSTGDIVPQLFDFGNLDISMSAGTYYLFVSGGNVAWAHAPPLLTTAGTIGQEQVCDPTLGCRWQSVDSTLAMEIDGTIATPEPSTFALLATGILGLAGATRGKFSRT
jgi:PEP-CTERM motif